MEEAGEEWSLVVETLSCQTEIIEQPVAPCKCTVQSPRIGRQASVFLESFGRRPSHKEAAHHQIQTRLSGLSLAILR